MECHPPTYQCCGHSLHNCGLADFIYKAIPPPKLSIPSQFFLCCQQKHSVQRAQLPQCKCGVIHIERPTVLDLRTIDCGECACFSPASHVAIILGVFAAASSETAHHLLVVADYLSCIHLALKWEGGPRTQILILGFKSHLTCFKLLRLQKCG